MRITDKCYDVQIIGHLCSQGGSVFFCQDNSENLELDLVSFTSGGEETKANNVEEPSLVRSEIRVDY